ncbi:glucosidase II beta subunit-like-domain-containing protein [Schizophyllum amplum]|uniref:Glucosidase 2 subunit beta n=1 Tax=Schizophyllum amplum TaxID=97359 RepID=A0A550CUU2_9AGAR|nr:glucosidase II beta subunit-like-domain-containing protein [Auriculariopsis ampla]
MRAALLLLPILSPALAAYEKTTGVPPALLSKYAPHTSGKWSCLDGSKEIPWDFVNDDSCDCPDGSDEPGTSACPNSTFYCRNDGHFGATITSSRVNDGLCEKECCDGSDELPGVCPNTCKEVGEAYRKKRAEEIKIQKTGSKIRSSYITFAQKEKKRLEGLVQNLADEIALREKEVARLRDISDRAESMSAAALERKKQSPLYLTLIEHASALKSLQREYKKRVAAEKKLGEILDTLRSGYNPNYQDMAVLAAVRGWEEHAGLPHIGVEADAAEHDEQAEPEKKDKKTAAKKEEALDEDAWTLEELEEDLDELLKMDYLSLLLESDDSSSASGGSMIFDIAAYLPDSVIPAYEDFKDALVILLQTFGIISPQTDRPSSADTSKSRQALLAAEKAVTKVQKELKDADDQLGRLNDPAGYGPEGEWKKLQDLCISREMGDYNYELCFFKEAKQKPLKGGTTFSLGKWGTWNPEAESGTAEYYAKQVYTKGARCWNGPERTLTVLLTCGTENAVTSVSELEKCQYQYTATTPALCMPVEEGVGRDEL